ncbi:MAG: M28 family peptidase [Bacteroidetes bacterium]|nr:MAG: M28 family peptidase [Bacteroidota bacterium]
MASDELKGRRTGTEENRRAARFLAGRFEEFGLLELEGAPGYLQPLPFREVAPPEIGLLEVGEAGFRQGEDLLVVQGAPLELHGEGVFAGYGWVDSLAGRDDFEGLDCRGKVVFVLGGSPEGRGLRDLFRAMEKKRRWASERGARALVELYQLPMPWPFFRRYFGRKRLTLGKDSTPQDDSFTHAFVNAPDKGALKLKIKAGAPVHLKHSGTSKKTLSAANVVGWVPGSDSLLREEFILVTAHFDHVGTTALNGGGTPEDSIFNGARDNAIGTVALLNAAYHLAHRPARRSVVFLAVNAEEMGLLGSSYYAEHPLVPLEKTVFNLNTDGAGYTDTTLVAFVGMGRTNADSALLSAARAQGLQPVLNPAPEQNLYERSDNISFSARGVPSVSISPGFREMSKEIMRHYHQVTDEADTLDFQYVTRFCRVFAEAVRRVADQTERPFWSPGDPFEAVGKALYHLP